MLDGGVMNFNDRLRYDVSLSKRMPYLNTKIAQGGSEQAPNSFDFGLGLDELVRNQGTIHRFLVQH